jgi:hypothetical protein
MLNGEWGCRNAELNEDISKQIKGDRFQMTNIRGH